MKSILYPLFVSIAIVLITFGIFHTFEDSFSNTLHLLEDNPIMFGIVSFLILASDIVLPVPSSIILYLNGYFIGIIAGTAVSLSGLMVGCVIGYYIGSISSNIFKSESNQKANQILSKFGPSAIFLTRGIPILSESVCFVCGYNKTKLKQYLIFNFLGYLPVCLLHAIFGKMGYVGTNTFLLSFTCSIALSVVFWFFGKKILGEYSLTTDK